MKAWRRYRHDLKAMLVHGWPYAANRFLRRLPPVSPGLDGSQGPAVMDVHVLTSAQDHIIAIWAAASYLVTTGRGDRFVFHDDGTLRRRQIARLVQSIAGCGVLERREMDARVESALRSWPRLLAIRRRYPAVLKYVDFVVAAAGRPIVAIDSDVLFLAHPVALLRAMESTVDGRRGHTFIRDYTSSYWVWTEDDLKRLPGFVNTGLGVIQTGCVDFDSAEAFLRRGPLEVISRPHIEQTFWALECARVGVEYLPDSYRVATGPGVEGLVAKHYVGPVRDLFYTEGIPYVRRMMRHGHMRGAGA